ncbi:MAG: histidine kinase [Spirochaetaceae bacterium]|nr:MAG: histidine kinase [Spirochaetaceae bacterium]
MTENRKNEFLSLSLAHAGELAYAEEAPGTCALLGHLNSFFRYLCGSPEKVILRDEIRACEAYVAIQQISTPWALTVTFEVAGEVAETLVTRFSVIDILDRFVNSVRNTQSAGVAVAVRIVRTVSSVQCELRAEKDTVPAVVTVLS